MKIVQISTPNAYIIAALTDDGEIYKGNSASGEFIWEKIPPLPQQEIKPTPTPSSGTYISENCTEVKE